MTDTGALPPEHKVGTFDELCLFLGGSTDSFTGLLLTLIAKADRRNQQILLSAYPRHFVARALWAGAATDQWRADDLADAVGLVLAMPSDERAL